MTLKQLKALLINRDWVSSHELASYFGSDATTIEQMMSHWIRVGSVIKKTSCNDCHPFLARLVSVMNPFLLPPGVFCRNFY